MPRKSSRQLIGPLMLDVAGLALQPEDREVLSHPLVGGVILFSRNYRDPEQLKALCQDILAIKSSPRLLLAVDHEGGRIQRFRVGFSRVPAMRDHGHRYREDPVLAVSEARNSGALIGRELTEYGIDLCFAPVLDRDIGVSGVIGNRAFSDNVETIVALSRAFRQGLNQAGMAATGKHFPGHGAVPADSHHELPIDRRPMQEIEATELEPFRQMIDDGIESLMMAHVRYTAFDDRPASLSRKWISTLLRRKLGFKNAVFCDDLSMHGAAVAGTMTERCRLALDAGCDMLPVCNDRDAALEVLDGLKDIKPSPAKSQRLWKCYRSDGPRG